MALSLIGTIKEFCQPRTGQGRNGGWSCQDFVISVANVVNGQELNKEVAFQVWNGNPSLQGLSLGSQVKVSFDVQSTRNSSGNFFTNLKAWKVEPVQAQPQQQYCPPQGYPQVAPY